MTFLQTWIVVLLVIVYNVAAASAECVDKISTKYPIDILNSDGDVINTVKSCKMLMKQHPDQCEKVGVEGEKCCKTCGDHTCIDKVGPYAPYIVNGKAYTSCMKLIKNHRSLCKSLSQNYAHCCRTCKGVDTSCVDELVLFGGKNCKEFVKEDSCRCIEEPAKSQCCESCKKQKTKKCACRDFLSKEFPAKVNIRDNNSMPIVVKDVDNCKEIVMYYAEFCQPLGKEGGACCMSCKGVDPNCSDTLSWTITVTQGRKQCVDCTCHDLMRKSKSMMRKACKENLMGDNIAMGAKEACCLQCKRAKK